MNTYNEGLTLKKFIFELQLIEMVNPEARIIISSDEEFNCLFKGFLIDHEVENKQIIIADLSGCELEE